jgi:hypothetical protein
MSGGGAMFVCQSKSQCWFSAFSTSKKSLLWMAAILLFDVGEEGFYTWSLIACPPWLFMSSIKAIVQQPDWRTCVVRIAMPILTFAIAYGNGELQWKISDINAERIIKACDEYQADNGRFPDKLDDLVPKYLASVPPAKYCMTGDFKYYSNKLWWNRHDFHRRIYYLNERRWSALD